MKFFNLLIFLTGIFFFKIQIKLHFYTVLIDNDSLGSMDL